VLADAKIYIALCGFEAAQSLKERGLAALVLPHQTGDVWLYLNERGIKDVFEMVYLNRFEQHPPRPLPCHEVQHCVHRLRKI
jgi:hypothetical protein